MAVANQFGIDLPGIAQAGNALMASRQNQELNSLALQKGRMDLENAPAMNALALKRGNLEVAGQEQAQRLAKLSSDVKLTTDTLGALLDIPDEQLPQATAAARANLVAQGVSTAALDQAMQQAGTDGTKLRPLLDQAAKQGLGFAAQLQQKNADRTFSAGREDAANTRTDRKAALDQAALQASPEFKGKVAGAVSQAELPAKLAETKAKEELLNQPFDPQTIDFMAEQALAGDKSVFSQMGFGPTGAANRKALRDAVASKAKDRGMGGADAAALNAEFSGLQAGERTLGNRTANIEMAVTEAQQMAPLALTASAKVNRSQFPTLNSVLLSAEKGTGGEDVVRLGVATNSLINIYARAISPTGVPTVSDKDHARELLSAAWSNGQYAAGVDQMMKELAVARKSPGNVRGAFRSAISGGKEGSAPIPDAPSTQSTSLPPGWTVKVKP